MGPADAVNLICPVGPEPSLRLQTRAAKKAKVVHVGFDDPPTLAKHAKTEEEALAHYRRVRDEIKEFVRRLPGARCG